MCTAFTTVAAPGASRTIVGRLASGKSRTEAICLEADADGREEATNTNVEWETERQAFGNWVKIVKFRGEVAPGANKL